MVNNIQTTDSGHACLSQIDLLAACDNMGHDILITRLCTTSGYSRTVLGWFTLLLDHDLRVEGYLEEDGGERE